MKWVSHKMATGAFLYTVTGNLLISALGVLGSTFPDFIEGRPPQQGTPAYNSWRKKHRGLSHWLIPYLTITILGLKYLNSFHITTISANKIIPLIQNWQYNIDIIIVHFLTYWCTGCVLHILQDSICGRVPLITPYQKIGVRLFKVGSIWEYLLVFPTSVLFIFWRLSIEYKLPTHITMPNLPSWFW